jgi:diacylglycerol kinase family enzyme
VRDVEFVETAGPGDATRRVREALRAGVEQVVSVGGDGTHHEVLNGFFEEDGRPVREGAVLAPLPGGTGGVGVNAAATRPPAHARPRGTSSKND